MARSFKRQVFKQTCMLLHLSKIVIEWMSWIELQKRERKKRDLYYLGVYLSDSMLLQGNLINPPYLLILQYYVETAMYIENLPVCLSL